VRQFYLNYRVSEPIGPSNFKVNLRFKHKALCWKGNKIRCFIGWFVLQIIIFGLILKAYNSTNNF